MDPITLSGFELLPNKRGIRWQQPATATPEMRYITEITWKDEQGEHTLKTYSDLEKPEVDFSEADLHEGITYTAQGFVQDKDSEQPGSIFKFHVKGNEMIAGEAPVPATGDAMPPVETGSAPVVTPPTAPPSGTATAAPAAPAVSGTPAPAPAPAQPVTVTVSELFPVPYVLGQFQWKSTPQHSTFEILLRMLTKAGRMEVVDKAVMKTVGNSIKVDPKLLVPGELMQLSVTAAPDTAALAGSVTGNTADLVFHNANGTVVIGPPTAAAPGQPAPTRSAAGGNPVPPVIQPAAPTATSGTQPGRPASEAQRTETREENRPAAETRGVPVAEVLQRQRLRRTTVGASWVWMLLGILGLVIITVFLTKSYSNHPGTPTPSVSDPNLILVPPGSFVVKGTKLPTPTEYVDVPSGSQVVHDNSGVMLNQSINIIGSNSVTGPLIINNFAPTGEVQVIQSQPPEPSPQGSLGTWPHTDYYADGGTLYPAPPTVSFSVGTCSSGYYGGGGVHNTYKNICKTSYKYTAPVFKNVGNTKNVWKSSR